MTSLVANEGLIVCGLCNGTANVYSQVRYKDFAAILDLGTYVYFDVADVFQSGARLVQVLDCHSLGGQVQVSNNSG